MDVKLLHDNAPSHKDAIVTTFLEDKKSICLAQSTLFSRPGPLWLFPIPRMKEMLAGKNIHVVLLWDQLFFLCLKGISQNDYQNAFKMWIKRLKLWWIFWRTQINQSLVISWLQIRGGIHIIFFLFLHENICCGYSLEAPRRWVPTTYVFIEK